MESSHFFPSQSVNVISGNHCLHSIEGRQFLDSPEYDSQSLDGKFKVSIIASAPCTYVCWSRQPLEYLLAKEGFLAHVLGLLLAKDVADKLYAMNQSVCMSITQTVCFPQRSCSCPLTLIYRS